MKDHLAGVVNRPDDLDVRTVGPGTVANLRAGKGRRLPVELDGLALDQFSIPDDPADVGEVDEASARSVGGIDRASPLTPA